MIFSDFYKGPRSPLAKLRHHQPSKLNQGSHAPPSDGPDWAAEVHADLLSRDKTKVKDAVKKYLAANVRNDWEFEWPTSAKVESPAPPPPFTPLHDPPMPDPSPHVQDEVQDDDGYQNDDASGDDVVSIGSDDDGRRLNEDAVSIYSVVSEDPTHYKALLDWDSDMPVEDALTPISHSHNPEHGTDHSAESRLEQQARKRRELRKEMEYNEGLACFEARRAAWTQARTVRVRGKPEPITPSMPPHSPRRFFFRRSVSSSPGSGFQDGGRSNTTPATSSSSDGTAERDGDKDSHKHTKKDSTSQNSQHSDASLLYPVETIVPIPPPILPPSNPLRASIQPSHYLQLYDKLIINNLTPSCPINLSDMLPACVSGWKRDGEWPPRSTLPADPVSTASSYGMRMRKKRTSTGAHDQTTSGRRMSITGLLSRDKDGDSRPGKSVRHSLQRALGLGHVEVSAARGPANV